MNPEIIITRALADGPATLAQITEGRIGEKAAIKRKVGYMVKTGRLLKQPGESAHKSLYKLAGDAPPPSRPEVEEEAQAAPGRRRSAGTSSRPGGGRVHRGRHRRQRPAAAARRGTDPAHRRRGAGSRRPRLLEVRTGVTTA